ncbi:hypothetical protein B0J14DRAFT_188116 [Halenospora varia]|nr:hypothetical protein B0J14DRAFT_188116 [Halenospora varia]
MYGAVMERASNRQHRTNILNQLLPGENFCSAKISSDLWPRAVNKELPIPHRRLIKTWFSGSGFAKADMLRDHVIGFPRSPHLISRPADLDFPCFAIHKTATPRSLIPTMFSRRWDTILGLLFSSIYGAFIAALEFVRKPQNHLRRCDLSQFVAIHYIAFHYIRLLMSRPSISDSTTVSSSAPSAPTVALPSPH